MHPNPIFRQEAETRALAFAAGRGFGSLMLAEGGEVLVAQVPFALDPGEGRLEAHLVRSNPVARALAGGPRRAKIVVMGPDAYVSPDWYGVADQVPTWNYVAVHLTGTLSLGEGALMREHLDRLSAAFEARLAPKKPWTADKMSAGALDRLMRAIVPAGFVVEEVASTFKLNQNKDPAARLGAAAALEAGGTPGHETAALAALMREVGV